MNIEDITPLVRRNNIINDQLNTMCCVCLEELNDNILIFKCLHLGHYDCFVNLELCPICRASSGMVEEDDQVDNFKYSLSSHEHNEHKMKRNYNCFSYVLNFLIDIPLLITTLLYFSHLANKQIIVFALLMKVFLALILDFCIIFDFIIYIYFLQFHTYTEIFSYANILICINQANIFLLESYKNNLKFYEIANNILMRIPITSLVVLLLMR